MARVRSRDDITPASVVNKRAGASGGTGPQAALADVTQSIYQPTFGIAIVAIAEVYARELARQTRATDCHA